MDHFVIMREERYRAVRKEQYEYHKMAPPKEDLKLMLEHFGKRADKKAFAHDHQQGGGYKGPYPHATVVHQQQCYQPPPMAHIVQTSLADYDQTVSHHPGRFPQTGIPHEGHLLPPQNRVMDCNRVAQLYGGVVFTDYGRSKYPV